MIKKNKERGFTLAEILIVIIMISLLAAVVVPRLFKQSEKQKKNIAKVQMASFEMSLNLFKSHTGRYPTTAEGLRALKVNPGNCKGWDGPYFDKAIPKDPWSNEYIYECPGKRGPYDIYTLGADGEPGGDKDNADIYSSDEGDEDSQ